MGDLRLLKKTWQVLDRRANLAPRAFYMAWLLERAPCMDMVDQTVVCVL